MMDHVIKILLPQLIEYIDFRGVIDTARAQIKCSTTLSHI